MNDFNALLHADPIYKAERERDARHRARLLGSLLLFTRVMFKLRTGREFIISNPIGVEPHAITICRALTNAFYLRSLNLDINVAPGWGKSEFCKHFVAWAMARYPDSNFLYISYSHDLAAKHTAGIKEIMMLPEYRRLFRVNILQDTSAKDHFKTREGGVVAAFGASGSITGMDAGLPNLDRFSGCALIDDAHKPDEVHSDTIRQRVIKNYQETIRPRRRGKNVPIVFVGQRLHEDDLCSYILNGKDGDKWDAVILKSLMDNGFARYPEVHSREFLLKEEEHNNYVYHSQYQQNPQPSSGSLFKKENFVVLEEEPEMLCTFITADTAETSKKENDASVFSFWGIYKIEVWGSQTEEYALHWIDCTEFRVEPCDLEERFIQFYAKCLQHPVKPQKVCIEKKSTGATLLSILKNQRGISIVDITRDRSSGSKVDRYMTMQPYISRKLISLPVRGEHVEMCINHMCKITRSGAHAHDDICDTVYDAVDIALIKKLLIAGILKLEKRHVSLIGATQKQISTLRGARYATRR